MRASTTARWMSAGFIVAALIVLVIYGFVPPGHRLPSALRQTARWSFLLFSLATGGGALVSLFGQQFKSLAAHGRDLGLAFASAHAVHVALVAWLLYSESTPFPRPELVFFGIGVFWIYLLALLSLSDRARRVCGARGWGRIRSIGIAYIALAYFYDFASRTFGGTWKDALHYAPLLALSVIVPLLRLGAWTQRARARDSIDAIRLNCARPAAFQNPAGPNSQAS